MVCFWHENFVSSSRKYFLNLRSLPCKLTNLSLPHCMFDIGNPVIPMSKKNSLVKLCFHVLGSVSIIWTSIREFPISYVLVKITKQMHYNIN